MASWIASYDSSIYFDPLLAGPNGSSHDNQTTSPAAAGAASHPFPPSDTPHYAQPTESRKLQAHTKATGSPNSFSLHFTKGSRGVFGEPPRATKPKVDLNKGERPWEPKGGISPDAYISRSQGYVVKKHKSVSPKSALSFGSTTPRSLAMGKATYKGNHVPITIEDYSDRAPPPLHSPVYVKDGLSPNRSRGVAPNNSPPARPRMDSSMEFFHRFSKAPSRWSASQNSPQNSSSRSNHFVADFEFIEKNRERKREKARAMAAKFGGNEEDYLRGEGRVRVDGKSSVPCSPRFYALTKALWMAIIVETTQTNVKSLRNYLQVLQWRAGGEIDESEMSLLTSIYVSKSASNEFEDDSNLEQADQNALSLSPRRAGMGRQTGTSSSRSPPRSSFSPRRVRVISLRQFRSILREEEFEENDLDIFVALVINEHNRRLVTFTTVSPSWIITCESFFFTLDKEGTGFITGEEICALARGIIVNRLRETRNGEVDSMNDVYPSYEKVAKRLLKEMEMDSSRTTSRGLVKGIVSLASFKAFCIRSSFSEEDMKNCIRVVTEVDCGEDAWRSSVLAVIGGEGGGGLGPFLLSEAATKVGALRFSAYVVKGADDESLNAIAEDLRELHSKLGGGGAGTEGDASYHVMYKCLLTYVTKVRMWNKEMIKDAGTVGKNICGDLEVSGLFPCLEGLLPKGDLRESEKKMGEEEEEAALDSPIPEWLGRLQNKAGIGESRRNKEGETAEGLAMVTPIHDKNASLRNLTIATGGLLAEEEFSEKKVKPVGGGAKSMIIYDGDKAGFVKETLKERNSFAEGLRNAKWEQVWESKEKREVPTVFNFRNDGHVELHGEGGTLEALVDELLATNKLEILDKIRDLRSVPNPPPEPPISPTSEMRKKERRGTELLAALRNMTPSGKGGKRSGEGVEAILKLGTDMNMDDGVAIQGTPVLKAMKEAHTQELHMDKLKT